MPKPTVLTPEALSPAIVSSPAAATSPRTPAKAKPLPAVKTMPLQVRLPRDEVKAIKVAAAQSEQTISEFMLACFHAYMKARRHA
jgi:hypothetical protein